MANEIKRRLVQDVPKRGPRRLNKQEWKLAEAIRTDENVELSFDQPMAVSPINAAGTIMDVQAEVVAADRHLLVFGKEVMEHYCAVVESTGTAALSFPYVSASGLEIPVIADNAQDGIRAREICPSILTSSKAARTVSEGDIMMEATVTIDDVSDLGEMFFGWRTAAAFQANPDSYNDVAAFHIGENGSTLADGSVNSLVIDDTSATYSTGIATAWADAAAKALRVIVRASGKVELYVDGVLKKETAAAAIDTNTVLVPFVHVNSVASSTHGDPGVSVAGLKFGLL